MSDEVYHIVLTHAAIRVVRWPGADWQDLQARHDDFVTSIGPLAADDLLDLIQAEWPDLYRLKAAEITGFLDSGAADLTL
jgi:hypothetical protein